VSPARQEGLVDEQTTTAYPLKTERMLGERIYLRGAICIFGTKMPRVFASNPGTVQANQGSTSSAKTVYVYTSSPYNHAHHPWKKIDGTVWVGCLNRR
jgi:hypothetical protein